MAKRQTSPLSWQPSLLAGSEPPGLAPLAPLAPLARHRLDDGAWVDLARGWVTGADTLFGDLVASAPWGQRSRRLFDDDVLEPRLTAWWSAAGGEPLTSFTGAGAELEAMRLALTAHYEVEFDSVGLNLYRDGRDSVAWHSDRIARQIAEPLVAIVSLGGPRRFLLRPKASGPAGRPASRFDLAGGDLLVTGGTTQRTWQHTIPKVAHAAPRISVTFRHSLSPA